MIISHHIKMKEMKQAENNARDHINFVLSIADIIHRLLSNDKVYGNKTKGKFMYTVHSNAVLMELKKLKPKYMDMFEVVRQKQLDSFYGV